MSDLMQLIKHQGLYLAPFINSVILYFVFVQNPQGELWTTILKCLPIIFLMLYIVLKGVTFTKAHKVSQLILFGLIFSCIGDALLNIDLFPHGMGAFALAQICYVTAFGWRPLKLPIGLVMYLCGAALVALVFRKLDEVLVFGLPVYAFLLLTMSWRAIAQALNEKDFLSNFCAIGSLLFVISDGTICINMFLVEVPYSRLWIMSTYYLAQFAITLSTLKERKFEKASPKRSKQSIASRINRGEQPTSNAEVKTADAESRATAAV